MAAIQRAELQPWLLLRLWILVWIMAPLDLAIEGGRIIEVKEEPKSVIWVVQLSDLHFSVFHPDRANEFRKFVPPSLSIINPSLVFITGDLTDARGKDMFTMFQNEAEWVEYHNILEDTIETSGLDKNIFYDFRGNHDKFGVKDVGGASDFFSKYAISPQLGRSNDVNSVTIETIDRKHLFVTIDTSMSPGLRGTNLMGHPTDPLLDATRRELSQWDSGSAKPVSKIALGHFPLSFSTCSPSQNTLKHVFFNHSLSLYLCGHLHSKFGKNLKRLHRPRRRHIISSSDLRLNDFFWEWEVADWRKSRVMRILAVDHGQLSLVDIDLSTGPARTIVLPTSPPDSRLFSTSPPHDKIRALVFSVSPVRDVLARVYDSISGSLTMVLELTMVKEGDTDTRGNLFTSGWNPESFSDPSPDRYWLQVEATDLSGEKYTSEAHPFSVNGLTRQIPWTWKEFMVMGLQWDDLYYPLFWSSLAAVLFVLFFCKTLVFLRRRRSTAATLCRGIAHVAEMHIFWYSSVGYCIYLMYSPWLYGVPFETGSERMYMTYRGWAHSKTTTGERKTEFFGSPDVMVIVLPHIVMVLFPVVILPSAFAMEQWFHLSWARACSGKREDRDRRHLNRGSRWARRILVVVSLVVLWTHSKSCYGLMRAYEMNPVLHFPVFCFALPTLLGYVIYNTK